MVSGSYAKIICQNCGLRIEYPADTEWKAFPCPGCSQPVALAAASPEEDQAKTAARQKLLEHVDRMSVLAPDEKSINTVIRAAIVAFASETGTLPADAPSKAPRPGWMQISVSDEKTTAACQAYAFNRWDENFQPIGESLPFDSGCPRHEGCRSVIVPVNLNDPVREEMTFELWLAQFSEARLAETFGEPSWRSYQSGQIAAADLVRDRASAMMSLFKNRAVAPAGN